MTDLDVVDEGDDRVVGWAAGGEGVGGPVEQRDAGLVCQRVHGVLSTAGGQVIISTTEHNVD